MVDLYFPMIARMSEHAAGLHAERWAHGIKSIFKIPEDSTIDLTAASACDHDVHSTTHNSLDEAAAAQLVFFDWLLFLILRSAA